MLTDRYRNWDVASNGPHFIAHITQLIRVAKKGHELQPINNPCETHMDIFDLYNSSDTCFR